MQQGAEKVNGAMIRLSKACSYVLRHGADNHEIVMRPDGFVLVDDLLNFKDIKKMKANVNHIVQVVEQNDKKRFELKEIEEDGHLKLFIRAVQGHTLKVNDELLLERIEDPTKFPIVVHGTTLGAWQFIRESGLKTMARNHVHFAIGYPGDDAVVSGMRISSEVIIVLNLIDAIKDMPFFISKNGVILSAGIEGLIDRKYFKQVLDRKGNLMQ